MKIDTILTGCVVYKGRDVALFAVKLGDGSGKTSFQVLLGPSWFGYNTEPEWDPSGMAGAFYPGQDDLVVVAAAPDGRTWELSPASRIERVGRIAEPHCGVTRLAAIGDAVWACGMGRAVWRRESDGRWVDLSAPMGTPADGVIGFTGLAQIEPGVQIAVGWRGEIWLRTNAGWSQEDSPTNANLNNVSVSPKGDVVAVGDAGGLIVGTPGQWTALNVRRDFNLQGVCHFGDETFVCSDFEIFCLRDGALVRETRFSNDRRPDSCMNLLTGRTCAYCQGERDLFRFEGGQWSSVL